MLRTRSFLAPLALLVLAVLWLQPSPAPPVSEVPVDAEKAQVLRVIDGDTLELDDGRRVRLIGIDAPEKEGPYTHAEPYGDMAAEYVRKALENQAVWLERDVSDTDRYGRLLRYVYLADGTQVNRWFVAEGQALAAEYPPDTRDAELLRQAEQEAREHRRGLWQ